jgi:hypothetical protein
MNADASPFTEMLIQVAPVLVMLAGFFFLRRHLGARRQENLAAFQQLERELGGKLSIVRGDPALHLTRNGATVWLFIDSDTGRHGSACTKVKARGFPGGGFTLEAHSRALVARQAGKSVTAQDENFDKQFSLSIAANAVEHAAGIFTYSLKDALTALQQAAEGRGFFRLENGELTVGMTGKPTAADDLERFYEAALKVMDELKTSLEPLENILPEIKS